MSVVTTPARSPDFLRFYSERWIALRLGLPMHWDAGVTTAEQRREYIRRQIIDRGIADEMVSRGAGKSMKATSWRNLFLRAYGHPLQTDELHFAQTVDGRG